MPSQTRLNLKGLYLNSNIFSEVPSGSLSTADNVVIDYPSVGQTRRGQEKWLTVPTGMPVSSLFVFQRKLHAFANGVLFREDGGVLSQYTGSFPPPVGYRNRIVEANEAMYFTSGSGVKKVFEVGGDVVSSGVQRALQPEVFMQVNITFPLDTVNSTDNFVNFPSGHDYATGLKVQVSGTLPTGLSPSTDYYLRREDSQNISFHPTLSDAQSGTNIIGISGSGSSTCTIEVATQGYLSSANQVAYRIIYGYKDSNGYLFRGAPSGRREIKNLTGERRAVTIYSLLPEGIREGDFVQVYRSVQKPTSPDDEMFLVSEIPVTSEMIISGEMYFADFVGDDFLGEALYTNATQQGILNSNDIPPIAVDITNYKGAMLYANTRRKERVLLQFSNIPQVGQTIAIGAETYTAGGAEDIATKTFQVFSGSGLQANVRDTVNSLIRIINRGSADYYAHYMSIGEPEGLIFIEGRNYDVLPFTVTTTIAGISPDPGAGLNSDGERRKNRICVSKPSQPEAVPETQFLEAGRPDMPIERVIALRDSVFVFKEDGVFRIVGDSYGNMRISNFDSTVRILAPESAAVLDNQIFLYADTGVIMISENGVNMIGMEIEADVVKASKNGNFRQNTFGVVNDPDRRYMLFFPKSPADTQASEAYVFNYVTRAWTRWTTPRSAGFVFQESYYAGIDFFEDSIIYKERRLNDSSDFMDTAFESEIIAMSFDLNTITLPSADAAKIEKDMEIQQGQAIAVVEAISGPVATVRFRNEIPFRRNMDFTDADVSLATSSVTFSSPHQYVNGMEFEVVGDLPSPMAGGEKYFVIVVDDTTIQFAETKSNADIGNFIEFTDVGLGDMEVLSGGCNIRMPIYVRVAWNPLFGDNPGTVKHFQDVSFFFGNATFSEGTCFFRSSFSTQEEDVPFDVNGLGEPWGLFPWGEVPWGDDSESERVIRTYVPLEKRRGTWLFAGIKISQPRANVRIKGLNVVLDETGENFR